MRTGYLALIGVLSSVWRGECEGRVWPPLTAAAWYPPRVFSQNLVKAISFKRARDFPEHLAAVVPDHPARIF